MKKRLFFCAFFFWTVFFGHAAGYFAGEGVTDLKVIQDGNNGEYVFYIQNGGIKAVHKNPGGTVEVFKLFADSDMEPANVTGLQVNEIPQNIVTFLGEINGTVYLFSKFINGADNQSCSDQTEVGKAEDSFSAVETVRNYSEDSIRYLFIRNEQLVCCTVALQNGVITGNINLSGTDICVSAYSVVAANDQLIGYFVSNTDTPTLTLFILGDGTFSTVYSGRMDKESTVDLQCSVSSGIYCVWQSNTTSCVLKYVDGVFQKIHTEEGSVQYPLLLMENEDFSKKIRVNESEEKKSFTINDNYQTEQQYIYFTAVPVNNKKAYVIYKNETWNVAVTDFSTTMVNKIAISSAAEYVSTFYDDGCVLLFADRQDNQIIFMHIDNNNNYTYKSVLFPEGNRILSDIAGPVYGGGLLIVSGGSSHLVIDPALQRLQFFSSPLFAVSMRIDGHIGVCTYAGGYINVEENDNE